MQLEFGYGSSVQTVELPQENLLGVLHAAPILVSRECYETVRCVDSDAAGCIHLGDTVIVVTTAEQTIRDLGDIFAG